jgi:hypothetical protein
MIGRGNRSTRILYSLAWNAYPFFFFYNFILLANSKVICDWSSDVINHLSPEELLKVTARHN